MIEIDKWDTKGDTKCRICGGTGWLRVAAPPGHPKFGLLEFCTCVPEYLHIKLSQERNNVTRDFK